MIWRGNIRPLGPKKHRKLLDELSDWLSFPETATCRWCGERFNYTRQFPLKQSLCRDCSEMDARLFAVED